MIKDQFKEVDLILDKWLPKFGLTVYKEYKDYSVRSIDVVDDNGLSYYIWIERNEKDDDYFVKAHWDLGKKINKERVAKSWEKTSKVEQLFDTLDKAYEEVNNWIISNGNSRNWTQKLK